MDLALVEDGESKSPFEARSNQRPRSFSYSVLSPRTDVFSEYLAVASPNLSLLIPVER